MKPLVFAALAACAFASGAHAKGTMPEDLLAGKLIISDKPFPMHWNSVGSYVSQLKGMNKGTLWYDKKTGKLRLEYAAFFARPVDDVQVQLVIYDVTNGTKEQKTSTENFMHRGDRVLFNTITLDKEDFPMNKKYLLAIQQRGKTIASGTVIVRGEAEKYSGKVNFTDEEAKQKD